MNYQVRNLRNEITLMRLNIERMERAAALSAIRNAPARRLRARLKYDNLRPTPAQADILRKDQRDRYNWAWRIKDKRERVGEWLKTLAHLERTTEPEPIGPRPCEEPAEPIELKRSDARRLLRGL